MKPIKSVLQGIGYSPLKISLLSFLLIMFLFQTFSVIKGFHLPLIS